MLPSFILSIRPQHLGGSSAHNRTSQVSARHSAHCNIMIPVGNRRIRQAGGHTVQHHAESTLRLRTVVILGSNNATTVRATRIWLSVGSDRRNWVTCEAPSTKKQQREVVTTTAVRLAPDARGIPHGQCHDTTACQPRRFQVRCGITLSDGHIDGAVMEPCRDRGIGRWGRRWLTRKNCSNWRVRVCSNKTVPPTQDMTEPGVRRRLHVQRGALQS